MVIFLQSVNKFTKKKGGEMKKSWIISLLAIGLLIFAGCSSATSSSKESQDSTEPKEVVLYVTRHGKTMFNAAERAQGWSDSPLIDEGVEIAEQLGKGLKKEKVEFVSAYSSDSGRARETTELALKNNGQKKMNYTEDKRLREICFGTYEGDTNENMWEAAAKAANYKDSKELLADDDLSLDGMYDAIKAADETGMAEDLPTVKKRMKEALTEIAEETEKNGGGNVLVVSHGGAIMAAISELRGEKTAEFLPIDNASVTKISYKNGKFKIQDVASNTYVEAGAQK